MKRFTRITSAMLAAALTATSAGIVCFAAEDQTMKTRMTTVKQRLDIPEEYTEFSYTTSKSNNVNYYRFTWSTKDGEENYGSLSATIAGSVITNVNWYKNDSYNWEPSFAKLSNAKLIAAAKKYINEINPTVYNKIEIDEDSLNVSLYGNQAYLTFRRVKNGIPIEGQTGTVTVNKDTGELISYRLNWIYNATFPEAEGIITQEQANDAFRENFPIELRYTTEYDWEKQEFIPHLIYKQQKGGQIDAFTGKVSTYDDYRSYENGIDDIDDEMADEAEADAEAPMVAGGANKTVTFSEAEIEKLEIEDKLIKAEKELEELKKQGVFFIPDGAEITSEYCTFNQQMNYYQRRVSFTANDSSYTDLGDGIAVPVAPPEIGEKPEDEPRTYYGNFTYNAETGEVISFYCDDDDNGTDLKEKTGSSLAEKYLKKLLGDDRSKFGDLTEGYSDTTYKKLDENGNPIDQRTIGRSYSAQRLENDIICESESVSITVGNSRLVTNYNVRLLNVEYPKPDSIISASDAYSKFFEQVDYDLKYRCAYSSKEKKPVTALVYSPARILYIDAFTGKYTNSNGAEYVTGNSGKQEYTDLEGSKYKKIAEKLRTYGIVLMDKDGKLNENKAITIADFGSLIGNIGIGYDPGKNFRETDKVTRQLAAKMLVSGKYGNVLPEIKGIYKSAFSDVSEDSDYIGYIMISDATGLIKGSDGKFQPTAKLTRGAALKFIYDYLS